MKSIRVVSARDLGPQFVANAHRMVGQDGAYSIPLGDGRALWYFGDTLFGTRPGGESMWFPGGKPLPPGNMGGSHGFERMVTNCGLLLRDTTGKEGLRRFEYLLDGEGHVRQLVPHLPGEDPDKVRVWCQHGCVANDAIYLSYVNVRMLAEGPMPVNFEIIGSGLARGDVSRLEFERLQSAGRTIWWDATQPRFGSAIVTEANDGFVYFFGVRQDEHLRQCMHLARVPESRIEELAAYEYLRDPKPHWSADPKGAAVLFHGVPNEASVSWHPELGAWLAVHSLDLSGQVVARTAPKLWGPWSEPVVLWQASRGPLAYKPPYFPLIYAGKEHPELRSDDGFTLYLTYIEFEEYFPHLVEVVIAPA